MPFEVGSECPGDYCVPRTLQEDMLSRTLDPLVVEYLQPLSLPRLGTGSTGLNSAWSWRHSWTKWPSGSLGRAANECHRLAISD